MKIPDETYELRNFQWVLEYSGLWWDSQNMTLKQKIFVILKLLNITLYIVLLDVSIFRIPASEIPYKPYSPLTVWFNVMYFSTIFMLVFRSRELVEFKNGMSRLLSRYASEWEVRRFTEVNRNVWKFVFVFYVYLQLGVFILTVPLILDTLLALFTESEVFYVPFLLEGFLPQKIVRSFDFYFYQSINSLLLIISVTYFVSFIAILPAVVTYVSFVLEVIEKNLKLFDTLDRDNPNRPAIFRQLVEDHVETLRLLEVIKSVISLNFCVQGIVWALNTGYYFHFARKALKKGDINIFVTEIYLTIASSSGLFISNSIGEILVEKGLDVSQTIYNLQWFNQPRASRLDLMMVMRVAQKPVVIDFKNSFPLNYNNMAFLLNISYKLFVGLGTIDDT